MTNIFVTRPTYADRATSNYTKVRCDIMDQLQERQEPASRRQVLDALLLGAAVLAAIAFGLIASNAASTAAKREVIVFGDSLLDAGTYSPVAKAKFGGGRYTTNPGENFTQHVARSFGHALTPAFVGGFGLPLVPAGGLNYAQGGSRVTMQPGINHAAAGTPHADFAEQTTVPVKDQVAEFLKTRRRFNPDQVIIINGGANDIFFQLAAAQAAGTPEAQQNAQKAIAQAATDLVDIVATIVKSGATRIVLVNMPDIGKVPLGVASADHGQSLTQVSQLFNSTLTDAIHQQNFGGKVVVIDTFTFLNDTLAHFQERGFTVPNTAVACDLSAQVLKATNLHLDNPTAFGQSLFCSPTTYVARGADQSYMFADNVHPSTRLNALFAEFVEKQIAGCHWK
jgi:phospholipase/lecithinase/hemolysin